MNDVDLGALKAQNDVAIYQAFNVAIYKHFNRLLGTCKDQSTGFAEVLRLLALKGPVRLGPCQPHRAACTDHGLCQMTQEHSQVSQKHRSLCSSVVFPSWKEFRQIIHFLVCPFRPPAIPSAAI